MQLTKDVRAKFKAPTQIILRGFGVAATKAAGAHVCVCVCSEINHKKGASVDMIGCVHYYVKKIP